MKAFKSGSNFSILFKQYFVKSIGDRFPDFISDARYIIGRSKLIFLNIRFY